MKFIKGFLKVIIGGLIYSLFIYFFDFIFATALMASYFLIKKTFVTFLFLKNFDGRQVCNHCGTKAKEICVSRVHIGFEEFADGVDEISKKCTECDGYGKYCVRVTTSALLDLRYDDFPICRNCNGSGLVHVRYETKYRKLKTYEQIFECMHCHVKDKLVGLYTRSSRPRVYNPAIVKSGYLAVGWFIAISLLIFKSSPAMVKSSYIIQNTPFWSGIADVTGLSYFYSEKYKKRGDAQIYRTSGTSLRRSGKYQEAIQYFKKALEIDLKYLGDNVEEIALDYSLLGGAWLSSENYKKSIKYYKIALSRYLKLFGKNNIRVSNAYGNLGGAFHAAGKYDKAIYNFEQSLAISIQLYGEDVVDVASKRSNLAVALDSAGKRGKAARLYQQAWRGYKEKLGVNHRLTKRAEKNIKVH